MTNAWDNGMDASRIPHMTPSEVRGMFKMQAMQGRIRAAEQDQLAWLVGSYCATAFNAPRRYPRQPRNAKRILQNEDKPKEMTDDEMRETAKGWARRWNEKWQP